MSLSIDVPFGLSDIEKVFEVSSLLDDNKEEFIRDFTPEVSKLIVKKGFFKGPFLREYNRQFDNLIQSLIRNQLVKHFPNFTPEEIVLLTDIEFLKMITSNDFFIQENYLSQEGNENLI